MNDLGIPFREFLFLTRDNSQWTAWILFEATVLRVDQRHRERNLRKKYRTSRSFFLFLFLIIGTLKCLPTW